ncbi:hypothetical protein [Salinispira pacifica]
MATTQDALRLLKAYTRRTGNPRITYPKFLDYAKRYMEKYADEHPEYRDFAANTDSMLTALLTELAEQKVCSIARNADRIDTVVYNNYYVDLLHSAYARVEKQPDVPFPDDDAIEGDIPAGAITPVDIKTEFVPWIARSERESPVLLRLLFPEGIRSLIVPSDLVPKKMIEYSVQKVRSYLRSARNASYMQQKLAGLFRQRELSLKEMITSILATPDQAVASVMEPNDFTFQFWTHLSSNIIREFGPKSDKLAEEHAYSQAAYALGYYNVYYRGIQQKNLEKETALKQFEVKLRKKPYAFTIGDMINFTDSKGVLLSKKYPLDAMHDLLAKKTTPPDERSLPEMIRVRTQDKKDYYIGKEFILPLFSERLFLLSTDLKNHYAESWSETLRRDETLKAMTDDAAFEEDVKAQVASRDPLFFALLNYDLLFLCARESGLNGQAAGEVNRLFDRRAGKLRPLPELLGLERETLHRDALLLLPFWQAVPVLRAIVRLFQRLFLGKPAPKRRRRAAAASTAAAAPEAVDTPLTSRKVAVAAENIHTFEEDIPPARSGGDSQARADAMRTRKQQAAQFREAIHKLEKSFLEEGASLETSMKRLAERWNPLLDPTAKKNLVEDVNSLVRDYLRRVRSGFRVKAPDAARIRNMARELSEHEALKKIPKTEPLRQYIELYMLKLLGK